MTKPEFIKLKVFANSKKNCIIQTGADSYQIYVKQKAKEGLANKAALRLLADKLNKKEKELRIIKGAKTPNKVVKIL